MTVKTSVSITDRQNAFVREMVEEGRYSSASAVIQRGLDMLEEDTKKSDMELQIMREFFKKRKEGPFITHEEMGQHIEDMLARKKRELGL